MTDTFESVRLDMAFKTHPFMHQAVTLVKSRDREAYGILYEMGLGKSKVAIDTTAWLFGKGEINGLLIVAPKSICRNWARNELDAHLLDHIPRRVALWGANSKKFQTELEQLWQVEPLHLHVLVVNIEAISSDRCYEACDRFLRGHQAMMVIDESTTIKNPQAQRTKAVIKLGRLARYRRILTGTPVTQSPLDLFSQFEFLAPAALGSQTYYGFRNQYAVLRKRYVNGRSFDEVVGYQRLNELRQAVDRLSTRALKRDCLDLPNKIYAVRYVELSAAQRRYYEEMREDALATLSDGTVVAAPLALTLLLRLRQALCNLAPGSEPGVTRLVDSEDVNPRRDVVMELLAEAGEQKALIWANFVTCIKGLAATIAKTYGQESVGVIMGEVSAEERQELVNSFQDPGSKLRFLVMQPRTAGFGLTLTAATLVIYHDQDWSLEVRQQSEDRAHRIGQRNPVTYVDLVAEGTIDERIRHALMEKRDLAALVTGDAQGAETMAQKLKDMLT